jgi:hypothetical protein
VANAQAGSFADPRSVAIFPVCFATFGIVTWSNTLLGKIRSFEYGKGYAQHQGDGSPDSGTM